MRERHLPITKGGTLTCIGRLKIVRPISLYTDVICSHNDNQLSAAGREMFPKTSRNGGYDYHHMTNKQRIEVRIARDKARKREKKHAHNQEADNFKNIVNHQAYVSSLKKCQKSVSYKSSVQRYTMRAITHMDETIAMVSSGKLPPLTSKDRITIYERGKARTIFPVSINDRITQRALCDVAMVPVVSRSLIYNNGASLPNKGVKFTRDELYRHLREAVKQYGSNFYVMTYDFKSFFDSIPHATCFRVINEMFEDEQIRWLTMEIIKSYYREDIQKIDNHTQREAESWKLEHNQYNGICLGSQVSQIMALVVPNELDHYIKDHRSTRHYIRYMDDGILMSNDKQLLWELYDGMKNVVARLGLRFNPKKTKIVKATRGFVFMKVRYRVTEDGRIIRTLVRSGITRMRRKLKKLYKKYQSGLLTLDNIFDSIQSWLAHAKVAKSYHTVKSMLKLYNRLFGGYRITHKYFKAQKKLKQGGGNGELLQVDKWKGFRWDCKLS